MLGKFDEVIESGQKLYLRLDDDSLLEVEADKQTIPSYMTAMPVYTHDVLLFKTDDETLHKLAKSYLKNFKMHLNQIEIWREIAKGDRFTKKAGCFS